MIKKPKEYLLMVWKKLDAEPDSSLETLEYHSNNAELEQQPVPRTARSTMYAVIGIIFIAILWACLAKVDRVVVADGKLISSAPTIVVQPLENSIIKKFEVTVGQIVEPEQLLVSLDPTFSKADESRLLYTEKTTLLMIERLEAELKGNDFSPAGNYENEELQVQIDLFAGRSREYQHTLNVYEKTVDELSASLTSLEGQYQENIKQLKILNEIEAIYQKLYEKKTESLASYLNAQFQKAAKLSDVGRLKNEIEERKQSIERTNANKQAFVSKWRNSILEEITELRAQRDSIREELSKASKLHELKGLTAPTKAVVLEYGPFSIGSVARAGEAVMTLVPLDAPLEAEILIEPNEIGYVRPGDQCRIKLSTFPFQKHGTLAGHLRTIGNDSVYVQGDNTQKYKGRIQLTDNSLRNIPDDFILMPGMSLRSEIKIGTRRVITFFIYPLIRTLDESFREP